MYCKTDEATEIRVKCQDGMISFSYQKCKCYLKRSKGLDYLLQLLQHPFAAISALDLYYLNELDADSPFYQVSGNVSAISRSALFCPIHMTDERTLREVKSRLGSILAELGEKDAGNDISGREELLQEKEALLEYLSEVLSTANRIRTFDDDEKRVVMSVHKAIRRALAQIAEQQKYLAKDLRSDLKLWRDLIYVPGKTLCRFIR